MNLTHWSKFWHCTNKELELLNEHIVNPAPAFKRSQIDDVTSSGNEQIYFLFLSKRELPLTDRCFFNTENSVDEQMFF